MPRNSEYVGIYLYYNDHWPSHFHALYGEREAVHTTDTLEILRGHLRGGPILS